LTVGCNANKLPSSPPRARENLSKHGRPARQKVPPRAREELAVPAPTSDIAVNKILFQRSDFASAITGAQYVIDAGRTATGGAVTKGASQYSGMRSPNA
jgi:hypothetical protein